MVKKVSKLRIEIKELYRVSRQLVNYWLKNEIKTEIKRKTKHEKKEIQIVAELAENRKTSEMGCKKIAEIIYNELKNKGKSITIGKSTIYNYLKRKKK